MNAYRLIESITDAAGMDISALTEEDMDTLSNIRILVGTQPSYPLTATVRNVVPDYEIGEVADPDYGNGPVIWLATDQVSSSIIHPYAPRDLWS